MATWIVDANEDGVRLDHFVGARGSLSHAAARRVVDGGAVKINGRRAKKGARLASGDRVSVDGTLPDENALRPIPEPDQPLEVLHADDDVVVVNKPPGIPTHPLRAGEKDTLAGRLLGRFPECAHVGADPREAGFAHRLDSDTSGVLVAARRQEAWETLRASFRAGRAHKTYLALVAGEVTRPGEVELALLHDPHDRRRVLVVAPDTPEARLAHTRYEPIARAAGMTLLFALSSTGRMHQIRAHLAHLGFPLVGDALYGGPPAPDGSPGHFLHASRIAIPHPSGGTLDVSAPLPAERAATLQRLGFPAAILGADGRAISSLPQGPD